MQWRGGVFFLAFMAFFGVSLLSEELLSMEDGPRPPSPSFAGLRAQPSAELFRGEYLLRAIGPQRPVELRGVARMTLGMQRTSALQVQVASIAVTLVDAEGHLLGSGDEGSEFRAAAEGSGHGDVELVLRGVELAGIGKIAASGFSEVSPLLTALRKLRGPDAAPPSWTPPLGGGGGGGVGDVSAAPLAAQEAPAPEQRPCRLDVSLRSPVLRGAAVADGLIASMLHDRGLTGSVASVDCGFGLDLSLRKVDVEHIGRKVTHYAIWVNVLTLVQIRCFIAQVRHTEEGMSAAKLSLVCIAVQALMDAYDSFMHLSLTASYQYMFNTFAMISLFKFVLFALLEVRYLLIIWRCRHRDVFAAGWEEVRRHLSRIYLYFYGALVAGLVVILNCLDYLHVIVLLFQAYWVPQIVHDIVVGSKAPLEPRFVLGISATRCLAVLYLWGCPTGVFTGDLYPKLARSPSLGVCIAAVAMQGLQLGVMASQQRLGPRWFVPRLCLPKSYDYGRVASSRSFSADECVICMGELGLDASSSDTVLTPCDHRFHKVCLERWMEVKMECPTCRMTLPPMC